MELNLFSIILLVSGLLVAGISSVLISQHTGVIRWFALTMLLVSVWSLAYGFELSSQSLERMLFWIKIEYIGIAFAPATWLWFAISYAGLERWTKGKIFYLIFIVPTITYLLVLSNSYHGWYYAQTTVDSSGPFPLLHIETGPWYYVHIGYFYLSLFLGNVVLLTRFKHGNALYRKQTYLLSSAGFFPWMFNLAYILGFKPFGHIDLTPFAFLLMYILVGIALLRFRLFDIKPIFRDKVIESLDKGILVIDPKNRIVDINPFMSALLNLRRSKLVGKRLEEVFPQQTVFSQLKDHQISPKFEIDFLCQKGVHKRLLVNITPVFDKNQGLNGIILLFDDISEERKNSERIQRQAEELKDLNNLKDKLFSIISHDLKGPIFGLRELIKMTSTGMVSQKEFFDLMPEISKNLDAVSILMENLLAWTSTQMKGELIRKKAFDIGEMMDQHLTLFERFSIDRGTRIKLEKEGMLMVFADRNMIDLIIRNLLSNALKYCGRGDQVLLSATDQGNSVFIQVIDTGTGMSKENLEKLKKGISFTTFGKNREKGTGLGLVLVRDYIAKNGGVLHIESELNKGSAFSFSLPKNDMLVM
ncbi:sensor histidine kinase [Cecembia lonarensis]|uniref:histidine kinase n=1 Tax=Cecembia lonarensis (strain CCUG 58316 / KCTC 22772 / LW9) TaxID=1225176 RepID=K1LBU4_CECL9|nr:histidine kinase N-terminal 7TM domain-containing protein [Cecembia lonarensis]EKB49697.1 Histidine protein kinase divJ [Cecembia lonarensis LW9]